MFLVSDLSLIVSAEIQGPYGVPNINSPGYVFEREIENIEEDIRSGLKLQLD